MITVPKGKLANSNDDALKRKREELRKKLLEGKKIIINKDGNVGGKNGGGIAVPEGKLANDDALKRKREELRKKLLEGKKITINQDGQVGGKNEGGIAVPKGKLASFYWYDRDPQLFEAEKFAMNKFFPNFELSKESDGRITWLGTINTGLIGDNTWTLLIVYDNDYPVSRMGGSVKIYSVDPDIDEMVSNLGWRPHHLLTDTGGHTYMCTAESGDVKTGKTVTSAATTLSWAVKWIMVFELVLSGDITPKEFDARTF